MSTQKQIEKLRADIATIQQCLSVYKDWQFSYSESEFRQALEEMQAKLAALEAQAAAEAGLWKVAKETVSDWEQAIPHISNRVSHLIRYVRHLEAETQRLEAKLAKTASTCDMAWNMLNDKNVQNAKLDGKINELEAELARRPVVYNMRCKRTGEMIMGLYTQDQVDRRKREFGEDDAYIYVPCTGQQS